MSGTLYIVGTPIGNLGDLSPRAVEILQSVDFIAAEDTRVTLKLLNHFGIKKPMVSYFEHNKYERGEIICQRLRQGEDAALVSDAGMPAISDPGEMLVSQCAQQGIPVLAVPGPSAVVTALAVSGLPTGRFAFEGFLTTNKKGRRDHLQSLRHDTHTLIFYEAPHKLRTTLQDLYENLGDRRIALVRELTKIHEETIFGTLDELSSLSDIKGECVIVVEGAKERSVDSKALEKEIRSLLKEGSSVKDVSRLIAERHGIKKSDVYEMALAMQGKTK